MFFIFIFFAILITALRKLFAGCSCASQVGIFIYFRILLIYFLVLFLNILRAATMKETAAAFNFFFFSLDFGLQVLLGCRIT